MSNTQRIAKNTLMLYFRQILIMLVSLYTVRVVLNTLGAEDYGIYNVVAGVVTMFGFLSNSMATASQRYFSFELGRRDYEQLKRVFSLSLTIYVLIAALVLLLAETAGLWFVANKLIIPSERKFVVLWVYQCAVISFLFTILTSPYMAAIIAHEDMSIFAKISIAEAMLKLTTSLLLQFIALDKLKLYSLLMCLVMVINMLIYNILCRKKYQECKFRFYWHRKLFKEMASYLGWNLFGSAAGIGKNQGVNVLLNIFGGPVMNATKGIASQINHAANSFAQNFSTVIRPQIVKHYAAGDTRSMVELVYTSSKFTFFLMYVFSLPIILGMPEILIWWLKTPPEGALLFSRLALIDALIETISYSISSAKQATGKVKAYQIILGTTILLNFPVSWIMLRLGFPAYTVMAIGIVLTVFAGCIRLIFLRGIHEFSIIQYLRKVITPIFLVVLFSCLTSYLIFLQLPGNIAGLLIFFVTSILVTAICVYYFGLSRDERGKLYSFIQNKVKSWR